MRCASMTKRAPRSQRSCWEADPDAESAWDAEIERRIAAIEAGTIQLEPWEQVRHRIEKDILGR
jgi:putative addiction module component (TIGR02574 family)